MRLSRQIEQDIERTRSEMDETLDEFRERMTPRHLLDEALGMFQSSMKSENGNGDGHGAGHALAHGAKDAAQHVGDALLHTVKRHPLPSLLLAAGAAWLIYEHQTESHWPDWDHMGENSPQPRRERHRSSRRSRSYDGGEGRGYYRDETRQAYREEDFPEEGSLYRGDYPSDRSQMMPLAAWHEDYDWSGEDEQAWTQGAHAALGEIETTLSDESAPARERMRTVAGKLKNLSGQKYQSHWREWKERSGSVVDARTGLPYDDSYGCEFDYLIESQNREENEGLAKRAEHAVAAMRGALSKGGRSVRRRLDDVASSVGEYAGAARGGTGKAFRGAGRAMQQAGSSVMGAGRQAGHSVAEGAQWVGHEAAEAARMTGRGAKYAGKQVRRGAVATTRSVGEAMEEHPLAAGAAFLGLGLLVGLLVPETRQEDRLMGETSDRMKRKAYEAGKDAAQRAGHVAQETFRAAGEEAERQGIAPSQLAEQASQAVSRMAHDVKDQASEASTLGEKIEQVAKTAAQTAKSEIKEEAKQSKAAHLADDLKT